MDDFNEWVVDLRAAGDALVPGEILKLQKKLVFLTLGAAVELSPGNFRRVSGVVLLTPVDTGRARASWNVGVGQPDTRVPPEGRHGNRDSAHVVGGSLAGLGRFQTVWITSSLPYIRVLEFGEYPDPVQRGTWVKGQGYVVRSAGGYSKQAPRGMVRVTFAAILAALGRP